jgi:hypothetical protein
MFKTHIVTLSRTVTQVIEVEIEARNDNDAQALALSKAGDYDFSGREKETNYECDNVSLKSYTGACSSIIYRWSKKWGLKAPQRRLMLEAYRRKHMFLEPKHPVLETPAKAKIIKQYVKKKSIEVPRHYGWYELNKDGLDVIADLTKEMPWNDEYNLTIFEERM